MSENTTTVVDNVKTKQAKNKRWLGTEKRTLLRGLRKYGPNDVSKLKILLPDKSESAIYQMIKKYRTIAELGVKGINSPLDVWLRSGIFDEGNCLMSEALLFMYLMEDLPPPDECAGFDLKAAYRFLYETSIKQVSMPLPRKTEEMLRKLIMVVDDEVWPVNESTTTDFLISKLNDAAKLDKKIYERKKNE